MTEKQHLHFFIRHSWPIWVVGLVVGLVAARLVVVKLKPHYDGVVSFTLAAKQPLSQSTTGFYLYDGFYAQQAAIGARNNLSAWVKSPLTVQDILQKSGVDLTGLSLNDLGRAFKVSSGNAVVVDVSFSSNSQPRTISIGQHLVTKVKADYREADISVVSSEPLITVVTASKPLVFAATTAASVIFALAISLIAAYFRP